MIILEPDFPAIDPHPALVAAQQVTPAEVLGAAAFLGPVPDGGEWRDSPLLRSWIAAGGM